jgi:hypothetical protein
MREERRLRVLDNSVLRKAFGPKRDDVRGSGEDCTLRSFVLYSSPNIIRVIKSRRMRWAGHVAGTGER